MDPDLLSIPLETLCFIIARARQFAVKDVLTDEDESSNAADDDALETLEDHEDDLTEEELRDAIASLNEDQRLDLIALARIGMEGVGAVWEDEREEAEEIAPGEETMRFLLEIPLLADYLEEAASRFGLSCEDVEKPV